MLRPRSDDPDHRKQGLRRAPRTWKGTAGVEPQYGRGVTVGAFYLHVWVADGTVAPLRPWLEAGAK